MHESVLMLLAVPGALFLPVTLLAWLGLRGILRGRAVSALLRLHPMALMSGPGTRPIDSRLLAGWCFLAVCPGMNLLLAGWYIPLVCRDVLGRQRLAS